MYLREWAENKDMKKNNVIKTIIIIFASISLCVIIALTCVHAHRETVRKQESTIKEKAVENASKNGYSMQFVEEKKLCIEKDGVKYYFCIDASGILFNECEFEVQEEGVKVKEGKVILTIRKMNDDNIRVGYDDTRIVLLDDGTERDMWAIGYFISNKDYDEDSLEPNYFVPDGKFEMEQDYDIIMKFTTAEVLKEHYNKALSICEQLNEGL